MQYCKQHLSFEEQAERLIRRGLAANKQMLIERLKAVGYYRFTAYLHPYRLRNSDGSLADNYQKGSSLEKVWDTYLFDRRLRLLLLDAIERIEVAFRCSIAYYHTEGTSPFSYACPSYFPKWDHYERTLEKVRVPTAQSEAKGIAPSNLAGIEFVEHFARKYGDSHKYLPLWMAVSVLDFGDITHFYEHSSKDIRKKIAEEWGIDSKSLQSWLTSIRFLRNDCAHHARIWNKTFIRSPKFGRARTHEWNYVFDESSGKWRIPSRGDSRPTVISTVSQLSPLIFICLFLVRKVAPTSSWPERLREFLSNSQKNGINLSKMGLPAHWESHPLWMS